ncbi:MAG: tRNA pseudouridine(38-40) synthase [uncultured Thermomicrobiales bacterium]|uniref:tRNA pseudouridine synthase A n=1 Tax=uncultured Thermomicrobiales bacterium TaxID=1645740 RepID=A0A6J4VFE6_9BACT|nr:MAG: tRNA pseudouridine(38-40) synthase [uncultured Thermomicrobiales bacterium]
MVASEGAQPGGLAVRVTADASSRRVRLDLAYDGAAFFGAQVQSGRRTVGSELSVALERVTGRAIPVTFAGRTDRGVHADGQVAHGDVASPLPDERLLKALNAVLPTDLAIWRLQTVHGAFHARYDARWREYRYQVWNAPVRHPALARQVWHIVRSLDPVALDAATARLLGEHDFAAFAGQGLGVPGRVQVRSTVRAVHAVRWLVRTPAHPDSAGRVLEFRIRANGFLPQMVRTIVGAAIEVGSGKRTPEWFESVLRRRNRALAPAPAPPQGLSLWRVGYAGCDQPSAVGAILADGQAGGTTDEQAES